MGDSVDVKFVLFFDCPEETCLERALERGKTSGRTDDNVDSFKLRIRTYMESTMPIIELFDKQGIVKKVSSIPAPEKVFEEVEKLFAK